MTPETDQHFNGAKLALFLGEDLLVKLRDNRPDIPFPNLWDFPGGGREGDETPIETVIRETKEEFSLTVSKDDLIWARRYPAAIMPDAFIWFFVARLPKALNSQVRLGDEGQCWRMMTVAEYLAHPQAIAHFKTQLQEYLDDQRKN